MTARRLANGREFVAGAAAAIGVIVIVVAFTMSGRSVALLNVSFDPTREMFEEYNDAFAAFWRDTTGQRVSVRQSHGGSGAQARAVVDGLEADVVTLAIEGDVDLLAQADLIAADWRSLLPHGSAPYTSTIVFVVRAGNPLNIRDWDDLVRDDVAVITPNPKTSGGARWNFLAAWAYAESRNGGDEAATPDFVRRLYDNVAVLDSGARAATQTFAQRGTGDVLIAWENEAHLTVREFGEGAFEIVVPSQSILAEPPVAVVTRYADARETAAAAEAYVEYLYSAVGQRIAAAHFFRPAEPGLVAAEALAQNPDIPLTTIAHFGGWAEAQPRFFGDGGIFDQIYAPAP